MTTSSEAISSDPATEPEPQPEADMTAQAEATAGYGTEPTPADLAAIERQLGRLPRGVVGIAHRCACGDPDVVATAPRLPDGTPFPTTFYATCPRLTGATSTLETTGMMKEMSDRCKLKRIHSIPRKLL